MKKTRIIILIFLSFFALIPLSGCKKSKLETPSNLEIDEENNLTWQKVDNAKTYNVIFNYIDKNTTIIQSTRKRSYNLSQLEVGDYEITVEAISSDKSISKSDKSEIMYFHKYYETGCVYSLINNKTEYEITKVGKASGTFEIEDFYRGKAVTRIAEKAFKGSTRVENIIIGKNVMTIGDNAFYNCSKLQSIIIPSSVREIGVACFQSCRSLKEISIPDSIIEIPNYTFAYCRGLEKVELNERIESIGSSAFQDCSSLSTITIPSKVSYIGELAFSRCLFIEKITIPKNVETIYESTFYGCEKLSNLVFEDGSKLIDILSEGFYGCTSLVSVEIPDGVVNIDNSAFMDCTELETIDIPDTVSHIGIDAFTNTAFYNSAIANNDVFIYADDWLIKVSDEFKESITEINTTTLSNEIVGIADRTFFKCPNLKSVVLPASFKYIGKDAFASCSNLWKIRTLDDSIELIDDFAFAYCSITNISLGIGLKRIGKYAFFENSQLDNNQYNPKGWIPETVTSIGTDAFRNTKIYNTAKTAQDPVVYAGNWATGLARNAAGTLDLDFDTSIIAGIADYAFYGSQITSVQGASNARYIGVGAFSDAQYLVNVSLNRNLTEIRDFTFYNCKSLIRVTCPKTLKSIGDYAFMGSGIPEIDLSLTNLETIGKSSFYNSELAEIKFSKYIKSIGDYCFYNSKVENISLPNSLEYLGERAFYNCSNLKTVDFGSKLETIKQRTFYNCSSIEEITFPESLKEVERSAFYNCSNISVLNLNEGLEYIGDYSFYGLQLLEEINLPKSLTEIGNYAFKGNAFKNIVLDTNIKKIGQHAFYGCDYLTILTPAESILPEWHERFNSVNRPLLYGVKFNDDNSVYEISLGIEKSLNLHAINGVVIGDIKIFIDSNGNEYDISLIKDIDLTEDVVLRAK